MLFIFCVSASGPETIAQVSFLSQRALVVVRLSPILETGDEHAICFFPAGPVHAQTANRGRLATGRGIVVDEAKFNAELPRAQASSIVPRAQCNCLL